MVSACALQISGLLLLGRSWIPRRDTYMPLAFVALLISQLVQLPSWIMVVDMLEKSSNSLTPIGIQVDTS